VALTASNSIPAMVLARIAAHGREIVLRKKQRGIWTSVSWAELGARIGEVASGLQADGFTSGDVACVLAETRPEWVAIDLGILATGGVSVGVSPGEGADHLGHVLRESNARVLFVENEEQLDKALLVRDACPALQRIVILEMKGLRDFTDSMSESWIDFLARGVAAHGGAKADAWQAGVAAITADQPALLLFPPGKAGSGHAFTHGEVLHLVTEAAAVLRPRAGDERLAVLPMAQAMERVFGLYLALHSRIVSNYLESPTTFAENLQELQPTVLGADPQIWERLYARAYQAAAGATRLQLALYRWAIGAGQGRGLYAAVARSLVLRAVRRELGLARLRLAYVGAAPVAAEVLRWAAALGITIHRIDNHATQPDDTQASCSGLKEAAYSP
jgi:long-chain acyl-CoA synthetase